MRIAFTSLLATAALVHGQTVIYVDDDAPQGGDGASWETAFGDLQDALAVAAGSQEPLEIRIGQGWYAPDGGTGDRDLSFTLDTDVVKVNSGMVLSLRLKGGFIGLLGKNPDEHDPDLYPTVLTGDLLGDDQPGFVNYEDNSRHVVRVPFEVGDIELIGVTIRGGYAMGDGLGARGAGVLASPGSLGPATLEILDCRIEENLAAEGGAGLYADLWKVLAIDSTVASNRVIDGAGGGVNAIYFAARRSRIIDNEATVGGGVLAGVSIDLSDSVVSGNAAVFGGGIAVDGAANPFNLVERCTIANNAAEIGGGVFVAGGSMLDLTGSILWSNMASDAGDSLGVWDAATSVSVADSDVEGGLEAVYDPSGVVVWNPGNIDADPLFSDPDGPDGDPWMTADNDYSLQRGSACVDATFDETVTADLLGAIRPFNGDCGCVGFNDMGALELTLEPICETNVVFVLQSAPPGGDGVSWETAYSTLADALKNAPCDAQLWIAAGVYTPDPVGLDQDRAFEPHGTQQLYGGFAGGEQKIEERDPETNVTILSGDLLGDDGPDFANRDDNSHTVVSITDATNIKLDGLVITGGDDTVVSGAGVYIDADGAKVSLSGCTISANRAVNDYGGGLYLNGSTFIVLDDCEVIGNVGRYGGGIYSNAEELTIVDSRIAQNHASNRGGGLLESSNALTIVDTEFMNNTVNGNGGGAYLDGAGGVLERCRFEDNAVSSVGGALYVDNAGYTLRNALLHHNSAASGCGVYVEAVFTIVGGQISLNFPPNAVFLKANAVMKNVTLADNAGFSIVGDKGQLIGTNLVVWGNDNLALVGTHTLTYSCVEGGFDGAGNIDADPMFTNGYELDAGSPCIDAGSNTALPPDYVLDLAGAPRFVDDFATKDTGVGPAPVIDMGAYEFQGGSCAADVNGDGMLSVLDFVVFQILFQQGDLTTDCNADGDLTILDLVCFQQLFVAGCP